MAGGAPLIIKGQASGGGGTHGAQDEGPGGFARKSRANFSAAAPAGVLATDYQQVAPGTLYSFRVVVKTPNVNLALSVSVEWSDATKAVLGPFGGTTVVLNPTIRHDVWSIYSGSINAVTSARFARLLITHAAVSQDMYIASVDFVPEKPFSMAGVTGSVQVLTDQTWTVAALAGPVTGLNNSPGGDFPNTPFETFFNHRLTFPQSGLWEVFGRVTMKPSAGGTTLIQAKCGVTLYSYDVATGTWSLTPGYSDPMEGSLATNSDGVSTKAVATVHFVVSVNLWDQMEFKLWGKDASGAPAPQVQKETGDTYLFARLVTSI